MKPGRHALVASSVGLFLLIIAFTAGCTLDEVFGTGRGPTAEATTPAGVQKGKVTILYSLSHTRTTTTDISVAYSTNGGASFVAATPGQGGSGTTGLDVSTGGTIYTFVWDSATDLDDARLNEVVIRISPDRGKSDETQVFSLHNSVFLVASHNAQIGQAGVYELDLVNGDPQFLTAVPTGGEWPWDVLFDDGVFYVAHTGTNDVSALQLDEEKRTLVPLGGSPFGTGGIGSKYLAGDASHLFVSNTDSGTISIFDIDTTGGLSLNSGSGVSVPGCRSMVLRVGRLYVASETAGEIVIFDIGSGGELIPNAFSPTIGVGMVSPRSMALLGSFLYASNFDSAALNAFRFLGGGELLAVAGSPFTFTDSGVEGVYLQGGERLFLAGGAAASFTSMALDVTGVATEETSSPISASGPVNAVTGDEDIVVAGTSTSKTLEIYRVDSTGALTAVQGSPFTANAGIARMAVSD